MLLYQRPRFHWPKSLLGALLLSWWRFDHRHPTYALITYAMGVGLFTTFLIAFLIAWVMTLFPALESHLWHLTDLCSPWSVGAAMAAKTWCKTGGTA